MATCNPAFHTFPVESVPAALIGAWNAQEQADAGVPGAGGAWTYSVEPVPGGFAIAVTDETGTRLGRL